MKKQYPKDIMEYPEPNRLWRYFAELSLIPRDSKQEARAAEYIAHTAERLGLRYKTDAIGNVLVTKSGLATKNKIILQAHLDMVCEKDKACNHDFTKDSITLVRNGDWVKAAGTTLGADNGIGVATMLAIMEDRCLIHPDLELLFTVEEETGLTGAMLMEKGFVSGHTLINLDSGDEQTLTIGCAGGKDTVLTCELVYNDAPSEYVPVLLSVKGLQGGHSGVDIHMGRGNALKLLVRVLIGMEQPFALADIYGGNKRNAIPREAQALLYIDPHSRKAVQQHAECWNTLLRQELKGIDDGVDVTVTESEDDGKRVVIASDDQPKILNILAAIPHGVIGVNLDVPTVTTSTNLAICEIADGRLKVDTSQRSIQVTLRDALSAQVASIARLAGATCEHMHVYPAWRPDFASHILGVAKTLFRDCFRVDPKITVIHAGLECAVIGDKLGGIDMISFGPTIEQAHSPSERVSIASVARFWRYLVCLLETLAKT
jgi:dipeptidase D